ncbi:MAG: NrpR regulatory domain-containing protein [Candidatus Bathyarchaeia archaeon]
MKAMVSPAEEGYRKEIEILRILSENRMPMGSTILQRELTKKGFLVNDRTVRYHLQLLAERGLIRNVGRHGRIITDKGLEELHNALAFEKVNFVITRYLSLAYRVSYNPQNRKGLLVANVSIIEKDSLERVLEIVRRLRREEILPAPYVKILYEDEEYQNVYVPKGKIGIFTVCNLTIDGILMHAGIPLILRYGGLVQFVNRKPSRFTELVAYEGTTIPPPEIFVYRRLTSVMRFLETGSGMLPANLREIPNEAREAAESILRELRNDGWGGLVAIGRPNEPVLGVPVSMDRCGISMIAGIIPLAALMEMNIPAETFAPHCLLPIEEMERID